jgi:coenzyme F420 biosynthesis associated uncharacterized protein
MMRAVGDNEVVNLAAEKLVDWRFARATGARVGGGGPPLSALDRARLVEDFSELVPEAERWVIEFTLLDPGQPRSRPWVMNRPQWVTQNLMAFERILEPFARKVLSSRLGGTLAPARRMVLGAQVGGLLGYVSHRVLGQYDVFLPPDDEGLLYFVAPNVVTLERKHRFAPQAFRLWLSLHEVAHRVQFGATPWLRGHLSGLMESYLDSVELDPRWLIEMLRRAVEDMRRHPVEYRGFGWIFLFMTPDQRDIVRQMQAIMSLLEGHGTFVMNRVASGRIPGAERFDRTLHERRNRAGVERMLHKVIGFDMKVRQYDMGERFVAAVVGRVGMDGFNRVWEHPDNLPRLEEISRPELWVARVAAA